MSPFAKPYPDIPFETLQAARKAYGADHVYLMIGDQLEEILSGIQFSLLDPSSSLNTYRVINLALITAFQTAEGLPDPTASEASQQRIDWKYALHQPLDHPGFTAVALCQFRQNLFSSHKALPEMTQIYLRLREKGLAIHNPSSDFDADEALNAICMFTRYYLLSRSMKAALSMLVAVNPEWLRENALPHWYVRYKTGPLMRPAHLNASELNGEARALGTDIRHLLDVLVSQNRQELINQPEMRDLAQHWQEQFFLDGKTITWRFPSCASCKAC